MSNDEINKETLVDFDNTAEKAVLSIKNLIEEAQHFCEIVENNSYPNLYGVSDGKAIGTYIESEFKDFINEKYHFELGNAARGIDLPGKDIVTDIKVTRSKHPQSSSPFKDVRQKIYGLGYNLLLFVYDKVDDYENQEAHFKFASCAFISKERTADFSLTRLINEIISNEGNEDDLFALFEDKNLPGDDITYRQIAEEVLSNPPIQGYLTISNALQWRLQYKRIVQLKPGEVKGIMKVK